MNNSLLTVFPGFKPGWPLEPAARSYLGEGGSDRGSVAGGGEHHGLPIEITEKMVC